MGIFIFNYPKYLSNPWKILGVYLPWVSPDLWVLLLILSHSTEKPFCLLQLGFGCFACCK